MEENSETLDKILQSLSEEEKDMIAKGKKHWNSIEALEHEGGYVRSETISLLIDKVIENAWVNAYLFYKEKFK